MEDVERAEGGELNETGATGEAEAVESAEDAEAEQELDDEQEAEEAALEEGTAKYVITGLVDKMDDQHQIVGQYPVGSGQVLPIAEGDRAVEAGQATKVE